MKSKIQRLLKEKQGKEAKSVKEKLLEKALAAKTIKELKEIVIELIQKIK